MEAPETPTLSSKRRWVRRLARISVGCAATLVVLWTVAFFAALRARDQAVARLHERGEPATMRELLDSLRQVSSDETGSEAFVKAVIQSRPYRNLPFKDQEGVQFTGWPLAAPPQRVVDELQRHANTFELLREALRAKGCAANLLALDDGDLDFEFVSDSRDLQRLLFAKCYVDMHSNLYLQAYDDILLILGYADLLADLPFFVPQSVRSDAYSKPAYVLPLCLSVSAPTDKQFHAIDSAIAVALQRTKIGRIVRGERTLLASALRHPSEFRTSFARLRHLHLTGRWGPPWFERQIRNRWFELVSTPIGLPWRLNAEAKVLSYDDEEAIALFDKPPPWSDSERSTFKKFVDPFTLGHAMGVEEDSMIAFLHGIGVRIHRKLTLARWALRLRRYFDRHERFPAELSEICDATLPTIDAARFGAAASYSAAGKRVTVTFPKAEEHRRRPLDAREARAYGLSLDLEILDRVKR